LGCADAQCGKPLINGSENRNVIVYVADIAAPMFWPLPMRRPDSQPGFGQGYIDQPDLRQLKAITNSACEEVHGPPKLAKYSRLISGGQGRHGAGWEARTSLQEGLEKTVAHFRDTIA